VNGNGNGAMVFDRVHVDRLKFGSVLLWSRLISFECLVASHFDRA